jgi:hypothetical protein
MPVAGDDQLLEAARDPQPPLLVELAEVPVRIQPSAANIAAVSSGRLR